MSDGEKKNGNAKIAQLVNKAKGAFPKPETSELPGASDDSLDLDVEDPTRPQETPPTLAPEGDDLELESETDDDGKRENFLGRMTMAQRVILVGALGAAAFVGHRVINGPGADLPYLAEGEPRQAQHTASTPERQRDEVPESDGFEPIAQGTVTPDSNAIDLSPESSDANVENAFTLDPIAPVFESSEANVSEISQGPENPQVTGTSSFSSTMNNTPSGTDFDGAVSESDLAKANVIVSNRSSGGMTLDGEPTAPPSLSGGDLDSSGGNPSAATAEMEDIKARLLNLNSVVSSLSQSIVSIENEISNSAQDDRALREEVRILMSELKDRNQIVHSLKSRPELSGLVIFRAAANCSTCVPHALFNWNGKEVEVGDGLQWRGFSVAIRGDRLSLIKGDDAFHYWYR